MGGWHRRDQRAVFCEEFEMPPLSCEIPWKTGGKRELKSISLQIPISEHIAGGVCVSVVKCAIVHCSPTAVVVDLQTSRIWQSVVTSKSHRH